MLGTCTDVHESVESKLEAKKTRQQLLSVIAVSHITMFTVDLDSRVTMLEGALIWDSTCDGSSRWYIGQNVYDVFNRLNSLSEGEMPPFLQPLQSVLTGQATGEFQEHEIGEFVLQSARYGEMTRMLKLHRGPMVSNAISASPF